jgi:hypothetical protein
VKKLFLLLAAALTFTITAFAQIGSLSSDLVFTPITPCRILDTRLIGAAPGTPIAAGSTMNYYTGAISSFSGSGGSATDCDLQAPGLNIAAIAVNFVVVTPSAAGYITVFPSGGVQPTASTVNYTAGAIVANSAIVKVLQSGVSAMSIFSLATTHVVADVTGYYSKPVSVGSLECELRPTQAINLAIGYDNFEFTTSTCSAGYRPVSPYCYKGIGAASSDVYLTGSGINGAAFCGWSNRSGAARTVFQSTNCCRIPGR